MRVLSLILVLVVIIFGVALVTPWGHDFFARHSTKYAASFSEQAFRAVQVGDTRERVAALLGQPLNRYYILRYTNGAYNGHPFVPLSELPADTSVHLEVLDFSTSSHPPRDCRLVEVILDTNGRVESTRDYITD